MAKGKGVNFSLDNTSGGSHQEEKYFRATWKKYNFIQKKRMHVIIIIIILMFCELLAPHMPSLTPKIK